MKIKNAVNNIFFQLVNLIEQIDERDFSKPLPILSNSTIGQHTRHILEFFICLENGIKEGKVNYDDRKHDKEIETNKTLALSVIRRISDFIDKSSSNYNMVLRGKYDLKGGEDFEVKSNFHRELVYNIEHAIHHMALIKIGVRENISYIRLPADFGVASSTIRHKLAQ